MSVEDVERRVEEIAARWDNKQDNPSSVIDEEEAVELGILHPQEDQTEDNNDIQTNEEYIEPDKDTKEYEKLNIWETAKDVAQSAGVEALHFLQPKDRETQYESRTRFGENTKMLYRYGVGGAAFLMSFLYGGGAAAAAGAAVKGASMIPKAEQIGNGMIKLGQGLHKLSLTNIINPVQKGLKAARAGKSAKAAIVLANSANAAAGGLIAQALADFTYYRGEGNIADVFGDTDNPLISFLQTKETDSAFDGRLKNAVTGFMAGIPIGAAIGGSAAVIGLTPAIRNFLKSVHKTLHAKTAAQASEGLIQTVQAKDFADKTAKNLDLIQEVDLLIKEASDTGEEVSQLIIDRMPADKIEEAKAIAKLREAGEDIFTYEDGSWSISVSKWDDAYKVSLDEYKKQMAERDTANGNFVGDTAISHSDEAVKETWINRGWLGKYEELNKANANRIAKKYTDKWEIDNTVKVEFIDGLHIKGKAVEGNTSASSYAGRKSAKTKLKAKENIQQNKNRLKELEIPDIASQYAANKTQSKAPAEILPNITIQIDKNTKNPYAVLRAELEHARDIAKGEVPNQKQRHFSRYEGLNEAQAAPSYTYKKSQGKAASIKQSTFENREESILDSQTKINSERLPVQSHTEGAHQPKIDFTADASADDIVSGIAKGDIKFETTADTAAAIEHIADSDVKVSGHTFEDAAADADKAVLLLGVILL